MCTWPRSNLPHCIAQPKGFEPFWVVTKQADVLEVTRRNDLYDSTTKPFILGETEAIERMRAINDGDAFPFKSLTGTDEPEHGVLRKLFTPLFQNQGMKAMEPRVRAIARAHVDRMAALGGRRSEHDASPILPTCTTPHAATTSTTPPPSRSFSARPRRSSGCARSMTVTPSRSRA